MRKACLIASTSRRSLVSFTPSVGLRHPYLGFGQRSLSNSVTRYSPLAASKYASVGWSSAWLQSGSPVRRLSTQTTQDSPSAKSESALPSAQGAKKPKVELRPGPVKPEALAKSDGKATTAPASTQSSTASASKTVKPQPTPTTSFRKEALKEAEGKGILEQTQNDIEDGTRHGILAPPPAGAGMVGRLFHQAKELFKFYWAGLKYIRSHRQEVKRIRYRLSTGGAPLTWREHKFIMTNNSDLVKVVPFVLVALILEEIIPLIVLYVPGMLPSTCVLPSQKLRIDTKRHLRQREAHERARSINAFANVDLGSLSMRSLEPERISLLCSVFGISTWGITPLQRRRLRKWLNQIAEEDKLLLSEGSGAKLRQDEISSCLVDRGFLADKYSPVEERDRLRWWLDNLKAPADADTTSATLVKAEDARIRLIAHMLR